VTAAWPWLTLVGLGAFHGLNPAMGWLFAVGLGVHRQSRRVVLASLAPMALGHALSISLVAAAVVALGIVVDVNGLRAVAGALLILFAVYNWLYGHRHRVRIGMTTGLLGLLLWSFLMATAHGAGLMLLPALIPLCMQQTMIGQGSLAISLAAVGAHTSATLLVTGLIAIIVYNSYESAGLMVLRRSWINFDLLWTAVLVASGLVMLLT
jgi:hypothetical protein